MGTRIVLYIIIFSIFGCYKDNANNETEIQGFYKGIFERDGIVSNVELTLYGGTWMGESERSKYPALCNGSYSISRNVISFENACAWTAEFDWTLILSDDWNYDIKGNLLVLMKSNGDKYELSRQ
ncbi:hypothetical protein [Flagellimonas sp.]|uniref:hypothetical protein n=1 Tax=Flagellimonas sp. TaxID=2058762 RepID=UPI003BABEB3F